MKNKVQELYALEQLAAHNTWIHRLHPLVKLVSVLVFIVTVISFNRYAFVALAPYVFFPTILMALADIPYLLLLKRFLIALPFCLFAGISNLIFDVYGLLSFLTIMLRAYLCVMAVLVLVAVTPLAELTNALRFLRVPAIFVTVFELTYRYLGVLFEEASNMYTAYALRSGGARGIALRDMGSFVGQLLLRSLDRAERVYQAMKCRGYTADGLARPVGGGSRRDYLFLALSCGLCVLFRIIDIAAIWGGLL